MVEQQRLDPLLPGGALVDQRLAQPHPLAQLEDLLRRRPRLRQPTLLQQLAQVTRVGAVGLRSRLAAAQIGGLRRLREMSGRTGSDKLLDDEPPTRRRLQRNVDLPRRQRPQKPSQRGPVSRSDPPALTSPVASSSAS